MPIIYKKHLNDSDNEGGASATNSDALRSFLDEADDAAKQPPSKKRKLNSQKSQPMDRKQKSGSKKKTKSMLKRLGIKKRREKKGKKKEPKNICVEPKHKKKHSSTISSLEAMAPSAKAIALQKLFLQTLKTTTKDLEFQFKPSHFVEISREDMDPIKNDVSNGSLDVLHRFLRGHYVNIVNKKRKNEIDDQQKQKKQKEWIPYTKSMQTLIISPSVRKAVDTIKSMQCIKVKHSFVHKKQLDKMSAEEYEEYEQHKDSKEHVISLRICELFGKHRKIEYQQEDLLNKSWHCGVGGINRINKLMQSKHLTMKKCELIIIDLQRSEKNLSLLDMQPMCKELCQWFKQFALTRIKNKHTKIAFF